MQQVSLPSFSSSTKHGGDRAIGKRKTARPVVTKRPMHITMRASCARGPHSLLQKANAKLVRETLAAQSKKWKVRVMTQANVGSHLHLLLLAASRSGFRNFLRSVTGIIALRVTGARKGRAIGERFWDYPAFSRVVEWGKDLARVVDYIELNRMEAAGICRTWGRELIRMYATGGIDPATRPR